MEIDQSIFKAYDVRGVYPSGINEDVIYRIAQGYADLVKPEGPIAVGRDVRLHSEKLAQSLIRGLVDAGVDVIDLGQITTEMIYFAVGNYGLAGGIQITASHNPAEWNGCKMVRGNVVPISGDSGIEEIKKFVLSGEKIQAKEVGKIEKKEILDEYCQFILSAVNAKSIKPFKIVYNSNFGLTSVVLKRMVESGKLPIELVALNGELDGSFPKGKPDPCLPENRTEMIELVKKNQPDLGVAWDADGDRVFFCTGDGIFLEPYFTNTLLIKYMLNKFPGGKIIYEPRNTWALIDTARDNGGVPVEERAGHSFIKERMRKEDAVFASESSGHTFYRDFWYADCGILPLFQILEILSSSTENLSQLLAPVLNKYFISGEINTLTPKAQEIIKNIEKKYSDSKMTHIDGLSCEYSDWRFNLRISNTAEPFLRLNIEGKFPEIVEKKKKELVDYIDQNK